jgi:tRNA A37 N6-isopentenylltransferase MiaA
MPLTNQEQSELARQLEACFATDEPDAMVAALKRAADRMARHGNPADAPRWRRLLDALSRLEAELELENAPQRTKPAQNPIEQAAAKPQTSSPPPEGA